MSVPTVFLLLNYFVGFVPHLQSSVPADFSKMVFSILRHARRWPLFKKHGKVQTLCVRWSFQSGITEKFVRVCKDSLISSPEYRRDERLKTNGVGRRRNTRFFGGARPDLKCKNLNLKARTCPVREEKGMRTTRKRRRTRTGHGRRSLLLSTLGWAPTKG